MNASWVSNNNVKPYNFSEDPNVGSKVTTQLRAAISWADYARDWTPEQVFDYFVNKQHPEEQTASASM